MIKCQSDGPELQQNVFGEYNIYNIYTHLAFIYKGGGGRDLRKAGSLTIRFSKGK